jgi:hypothetical protein
MSYKPPNERDGKKPVLKEEDLEEEPEIEDPEKPKHLDRKPVPADFKLPTGRIAINDYRQALLAWDRQEKQKKVEEEEEGTEPEAEANAKDEHVDAAIAHLKLKSGTKVGILIEVE